jgi:hypothetical protein
MIPNSTQIPHDIIRVHMVNLSDTALRVILVITDQTLGWIEDPITKKRKEKDWISYSQLTAKTGRQTAAISNAIKELEDKKLIDVLDEEGNAISKENRIGKRLYYRLKTSSESEDVEANLFGKRNSESEIRKAKTHKETDTKETDTKLNNATENFDKFSALRNKLGIPENTAAPGIHKEFQAEAMRIIEALQISANRRGAYFQAVKQKPRRDILRAYTFALDYPKPDARDKMFFWKLNHLTV